MEKVLSCMEAFSGNPYPGRGIVAGVDETGKNLVQVYWIMGRSENSRNRVFKQGENGRVYTEAADPAKIKDGSLIFYDAMLETSRNGKPLAAVSNGVQTEAVMGGPSFMDALLSYRYEPDKPNYTPRITGCSYWLGRLRTDDVTLESRVLLSSIRKSQGSLACERHFHSYENVPPGIGYCLTTYRGDGDPLPPYDGEPYALMLRGSIEDIAHTYERALNADNFVSLVAKFIPRKGASHVVILNKYRQLEKKLAVVK